MSWVNDVVQGIFLGGAYALTAVGLSLMFGVMRLVNLAHGDLAVCGTYLVTTVMAALGVPSVTSGSPGTGGRSRPPGSRRPGWSAGSPGDR